MPGDEELVEKVKAQMMQYSLITAQGFNEIIQNRPISSLRDRQALAGYLFYIHGRLQACPQPPPRRAPGASWHD